jgi:hypothetical protein
MTFAANDNHQEASTFAGASRPVISSYFDPPFLYESAENRSARDVESRGASQGSKRSGNALKLDLGSSKKSMEHKREQEIQLSTMPKLTLQTPAQSSKDKKIVSPTGSTMSGASDGSDAEAGKE